MVNSGSYKAYSSGQLTIFVSSSKVSSLLFVCCKAFTKEI